MIESEVGTRKAATDGAMDATRASLKSGFKETFAPLRNSINKQITDSLK